MGTFTGTFCCAFGKKLFFKTVENLTREAFWNVYRPGCTEHYVLHCYRNEPSFVPELSLVLEVDARSSGT